MTFTLLHTDPNSQARAGQIETDHGTINYCVAGIIHVHVVINIGMTMGLIPTIGIPLPLVSAGSSSLIGFTLMFAVLLKLDSNRNLA